MLLAKITLVLEGYKNLKSLRDKLFNLSTITYTNGQRKSLEGKRLPSKPIKLNNESLWHL
jgi:hypothetical protein